jgi:flagellar basal-body rod modification protein FlgD
MTTIDTSSLAALNATTKARGKDTLGQADFLRLLTAQLQTQDPLNPTDSNTMVTQMQQLSQTSGIAEMNASLKQLVAQLGGSRMVDAATWIGHDALIAGDFVSRGGNGSYNAQVNLDKAADQVTVDLLDANGLIVHSIEKAGVGEGPLSFSWDGVGDISTSTGPLRVRVSARDADGGTVATTTNVWTPVTAVQSPASGTAARLVTPNGLIAPDAVIRLG